MDVDAYVASLTTKHANLEKAIAEESQRPHPDNLLLTELKRQKLKIKDEIVRLSVDRPREAERRA